MPTVEADQRDDAEAVEMQAFQQAAEPGSEADEPSLDEYFRSFMQRVGISEQRVADAPPAIAADVGQSASEAAIAAPKEPSIRETSAAEPRRAAPEEFASRAAMRELAVSSARSAIGTREAQLTATIFRQLVIASGAVALSLLLLAVCDGAASIVYGGALAALATALFFGGRFFHGAFRLGAFGRPAQIA